MAKLMKTSRAQVEQSRSRVRGCDEEVPHRRRAPSPRLRGEVNGVRRADAILRDTVVWSS